MAGITSNSLYMMERTLDYLWTKQAAHLDNISNAETPGYKVKTVRFEETFARKLRVAGLIARTRKGRVTRADVRNVIDSVSWRVDEDEETTRMDENGVNVLEQSVEYVRTAYQMQYTMQAISNDLTILNAAITG